MKQVLFVCNGGIFRSRLAQAIANSKKTKGNVSFISSGIVAERNLFGDIAPWAEFLIEKHGLQGKTQSKWLQTNQAQIDASDTVIFMSQDVYAATKRALKLGSKSTIWDISDLEGMIDRKSSFNEVEVEEIYKSIKLSVERLIKSMLSV